MATMIAFMSILDSGDEVINILPCYTSYIPQLKIAEPSVKVVNIDLDKVDFSLDISKIEKMFQVSVGFF